MTPDGPVLAALGTFAGKSGAMGLGGGLYSTLTINLRRPTGATFDVQLYLPTQ